MIMYNFFAQVYKQLFILHDTRAPLAYSVPHSSIAFPSKVHHTKINTCVLIQCSQSNVQTKMWLAIIVIGKILDVVVGDVHKRLVP
jgi:hypothetical protein